MTYEEECRYLRYQLLFGCKYNKPISKLTQQEGLDWERMAIPRAMDSKNWRQSNVGSSLDESNKDSLVELQHLDTQSQLPVYTSSASASAIGEGP